MNDLPLISVAMCTYNGAKFLLPQLQSIQNQSYSNLEIVIVDDCSTDDTYSILLDFAKANNKVRLYRNETNLGFIKNFEKALLYCKGDFIVLCDQDDIWHPSKIQQQFNAIGDNLLIYHDSEFVDEEEKPLNKKMSDFFNFYRGNQPEAFLLNNCVSAHAMLIKKELLSYSLPLKEGFFHDWWMAYVATNHGSIDYIPQCLVKYRQHESSNTDLLDKKDKKKHKRKSSTEEFNTTIHWLKTCADYAGNKNPEFVKTFYTLYTERINSYMNFKLFAFMRKNADLLFAIFKGNHESKLKRAKKYIWGLKLRNFWYRYVNLNRKKIVNTEYMQ